MVENSDRAVIALDPDPSDTEKVPARSLWSSFWRFGLKGLAGVGVGVIVGRLFPPFYLDDVFWRDFLTSPGFGGVAALVAAGVAFLAAWYTSKRSAANATADRQQRDVAAEDDRLQRESLDQRSQWWVRFTWATEQALDPRSRDVGVAAMIGLVGHPWASSEDADISIAVTDLIQDMMDTEATDDTEEGDGNDTSKQANS